jgi:hypothetical protein
MIPRVMHRLIRWFWIALALVFLFEAWLWDHLEPIASAVVAHLPLERIKTRIARWVQQLSPAFSLVVFALPVGLLVPFKLAGLWLLARGYWGGAAGTLLFAKMVGLGSTAFVFDAARDKLLQLRWFRALHDRLVAWRAWSHALVDPVVLEIKAKLAWFAPRRTGRALRLMMRIRRRVRAPMSSAKPG